jgi:hypothetical protein
MKKTGRIRLYFSFATLIWVSLFQASTVSAEQFQVGAQVCTYVNFNQAAFLEYSSEGLLNNDTRPLWVICPVATQTDGGNVDIATRIVNRSDVADTIDCVYRVTNDVGNTKKSIPQSGIVPPNTRLTLITSNINFQPGDAFAVQCNLPPGFQAVSFTVET